METNVIEIQKAQIEKKSADSVLQDVLTHRELDFKIEQLQAELKAVRTRLEDAASNTPNGIIHTAEYEVRLTLCKGAERFDRKKAELVLGAEVLAPFVTVGNPTTRLTVK